MFDSITFKIGVFKTEKNENFASKNVENLGVTKHTINTLIFIILPIFVENLNKLIERVPFRLNNCELCCLYFYKKSF